MIIGELPGACFLNLKSRIMPQVVWLFCNQLKILFLHFEYPYLNKLVQSAYDIFLSEGVF